MRNSDKLHRSNMVLLILVVLMLLYGVVTRIQSGDNKMYIFGFEFELPFIPAKEEPADAEGTAPEAQEPASANGARLIEAIDALIA